MPSETTSSLVVVAVVAGFLMLHNFRIASAQDTLLCSTRYSVKLKFENDRVRGALESTGFSGQGGCWMGGLRRQLWRQGTSTARRDAEAHRDISPPPLQLHGREWVHPAF